MSITDLVLLVGTNPLPNFVVAEYFLKQDNNEIQNIWLVYSEINATQMKGTRQYADNLHYLISQRHGDKDIEFKFASLSNISDAPAIQRDILNNVIKKIKDINSNPKVHLNYTGGTKAMGIHTYNTIKEEFPIRQYPDTNFSYLDGRTFQIVDEKRGHLHGDLRDSIHITFEDLIRLHGFDKIGEGENKFDCTGVIDKFTNIIESDHLDSFYDHTGGYNRTLRENSNSLSSYNPNQTFIDIVNALPDEYRFFDDNGEYVNIPCKLKDSLKFIDGQWLEEYVYTVIDGNLGNVWKNWEIHKTEWGNNRFELDIVYLKGYQLTGISCTTYDTKSICKSKGFEIILRTRQIGGDEAKAVVITRLNDKTTKEVQAELEMDTNGNDKNILVLGKNSLKADILQRKIIAEFINGY